MSFIGGRDYEKQNLHRRIVHEAYSGHDLPDRTAYGGTCYFRSGAQSAGADEFTVQVERLSDAQAQQLVPNR